MTLNTGSADGPIADAVAKAQKVLSDEITAAGGRVLCAVVMVNADGIAANGGGLDVHAYDDGPQTPEEVLAFAVLGVQALAQRYGMPLAMFPTDAIDEEGHSDG